MLGPRRLECGDGLPELLRVGRYRFVFNSREHDPPHVHVLSPDGPAAYELGPVRLRKSRGYTQAQRALLERIVIAHEQEFLNRWHDYFNR